jgi:ectoine hydroxylase-related dioxygenase (phytanoyl-CoA dioxygenase family)
MTSASAPSSPWIHSPELEAYLAKSQASSAAAAFARDLARDGLAIVDLGEDMAALCDQAVAETEPMFRDDRIGRVHEAWRRSPAVRAIAARPDLKALLALAYGREPFAFQTLNFKRGSQQDPHADSMHFQSRPAGFMCGVWVALEDVRTEAGPLSYYPGSHRLSPKARTAGDTTIDTYDQHHGAPLKADLEAHGLAARPAMLRKGQVAVWAADLAHGGSPILDPDATRRSLVIHFYFENCLYFTPMHSKAGKLAMRLPARVGGGWAWPRQDGRRVAVPVKAFGAAVINRLLRRTRAF